MNIKNTASLILFLSSLSLFSMDAEYDLNGPNGPEFEPQEENDDASESNSEEEDKSVVAVIDVIKGAVKLKRKHFDKLEELITNTNINSKTTVEFTDMSWSLKKTKVKVSPLSFAIMIGRNKMAVYLLNKGAVIDMDLNKHDKRAIRELVESGKHQKEFDEFKSNSEESD